MHRIAKEDLVGMDAGPFGAQPPGDAAECRRQPLHDYEPYRREESEGRRRRFSAVHGETDERPIPDPNATRNKVMATAARAPPIIAAQETADCELEYSSVTSASSAASFSYECHCGCPLMPENHQQDNDRDRYAEQPEKNGHLSFLPLALPPSPSFPFLPSSLPPPLSSPKLIIDAEIDNLFRVAQPMELSRQCISALLMAFVAWMQRCDHLATQQCQSSVDDP